MGYDLVAGWCLVMWCVDWWWCGVGHPLIMSIDCWFGLLVLCCGAVVCRISGRSGWFSVRLLMGGGASWGMP